MSTSNEPDAGKAVQTYLKTGDSTALDSLSKKEVVDFVTKESRPLQNKHGKAADGTAAAHRTQHARACERLRESTGDMTNCDIVDVMAVVDRDLAVGPTAWNNKHSDIERAEKKTRDTGAAPMDAKTKVTQSAVAERGMVRIDQIKAALTSGDINETAARWMLEDAAQPMMSGGVSPLALWEQRTALNKYSKQFRGLVATTLGDNGGDVAINVKDAVIRNDGTIAKTSSVVQRNQLVYKDDGTVDPKCDAYKLGLVDKSGRPTEPQKAADAGLVHVGGHWRGDVWVPPHQRHAPKSKAAAAPAPKASPAPKSKASPAPKAKASPAPKAASPSSVAVKGYTRADGTKVAGHTRTSPGAASSSSSSKSSSSASGCRSSSGGGRNSGGGGGGGGGGRGSGGGGSVQVSGYTRANGTYVRGYSRSK